VSGHTLGDLVRELESRGLLRTVLAPAGTPVATINVSGVAFDSRAAQAADLFVAVRGDVTDGHDHAPAAVANGAVAILGERAIAGVDVPQILVGSARTALALAAAWVNGFPSRELGVIGVTGTDGKTTTSYLVQRMLVECGLPAGLITTIDVIVGGQSVGYTGHTTPEAPVIQGDLRRMVDAGDRFAVVETTSHGLALERVADIAYDVAVFTNLTHEHLDLHGTYEAYVGAKRSLFERLAVTAENPQKQWPKGAVINAQDERGPEMAAAAEAAGARVLTYAVDPEVEADIVATRVHDDGRALRVSVRTPRWEDELQLQLPGRFNAFNALAAIGVGELLGLEPAAMRRGLDALRSVAGRMERIDEGQPFDVFVDFAHTPGALAAALDALGPVAAARGGSVISLFGSPGARDIAKRPMMGRAAGERSHIVVLTDDDPRDNDEMSILDEIAAGAEDAGRRRERDLFLIPDRTAAIRRALELARPGDIVLLAGKGHEPTIALPGGAKPWSEAAVARAALNDMGYDAGSR
jgi:UDP-N-acetylmuramoyl-L-alanyl-D-glutamate--2,6-diaminopimelate ligase